MRQYRGLSDKGWVYGWYSEYTCPEYGNKICTITDAENNEHEVDPKTVGQLFEIGECFFYEGDIVSKDYKHIIEVGYIKFHAGMVCVFFDDSPDDYYCIFGEEHRHKIIGTIHTKEESNG